MYRWKGKVALVTGTSAGIGLTIAKTLLKEGMTVVGIARRKDLIEFYKHPDSSNSEWENVIGVNVLGVLYSSKQAIKMLQQSGEEGHIININSFDSLNPELPEGLEHSVTYASKLAEIAITKCLEQELIGSKIRVTGINPGYVETNTIRDNGELLLFEEKYESTPSLEEKDIAEAIVFILGTHPRVQITELTIIALGESV